MKSISINNGHSTTTPAKAIKAVGNEEDRSPHIVRGERGII